MWRLRRGRCREPRLSNRSRAPPFAGPDPSALADLIDQERTLAAGIDDDIAVDGSLRAVGQLHFHADGPRPVEQHFQDPGAFVNLHAVLGRVVQHEVIEFAAAHLPGLRRLVRIVIDEVKGSESLPFSVMNCTLYFLTKWLPFILSSMPSRLST